MSETTHTISGMMTLVYSPDDGGFYWEEFSLKLEKTRTSKKIYPTREAAKFALGVGRMRWDAWH